MEELKQTRIQFDIAKRIVDKLANGENQIPQETVLQVLLPLLEDHIPP